VAGCASAGLHDAQVAVSGRAGMWGRGKRRNFATSERLHDLRLTDAARKHSAIAGPGQGKCRDLHLGTSL